MSNRSRSSKIFGIVILVSSCVLSACIPASSPEPHPSDTSGEGARTDRLSAISVGTEGRLIEVPVNDELATWLNTIDESAGSSPPTPDIDDWHSFTTPSGETSIIFDPGIPTPFDVLEILSYPEGLDLDGVPISVVVHPLCGPQAELSCEDLAWGASGVMIPSERLDAAIADTEYYAIAGILLPNGDSHPDSFMALLKKKTS